MFDHVTIGEHGAAVALGRGEVRDGVLGIEPSRGRRVVEWQDRDIGPTDREHPVTRGLHIGFRAPCRETVVAFWQAGIDAGYRDDGAPVRRTVNGSDHYGAFVLDPDGHNVEIVNHNR